MRRRPPELLEIYMAHYARKCGVPTMLDDVDWEKIEQPLWYAGRKQILISHDCLVQESELHGSKVLIGGASFPADGIVMKRQIHVDIPTMQVEIGTEWGTYSHHFAQCPYCLLAFWSEGTVVR